MFAVTKKILAFNKDRLPEMVKLKYSFISDDVFRFFRGTCHLFYEAFAKKMNWEDNTKCWITGDLHLENFGTYRGDNRVVYFDMNDFDEAVLSPATWEVSRTLTSIHLAANVLQFGGELADQLAHIYVDAYINILKNGKPLAIEKETATGLLKYFLEQVQQRNQKEFVLSRMEQKKKHWKLIIDNTKTLAVSKEQKETVTEKLDAWLESHIPYKKLRVLDIANRIAGTGSVGIERYVALVYEKKTERFHLIDVKQSLPSSLMPYIKCKQPVWEDEATRVVTLQKRVQHVSPAFLHTLTMGKTSYVVKELQPTEDRMDLALCRGKKKKLADILITMAEANASGQLRSSGRQGSSIADTLIEFANNSNKWKQPLLHYAGQYAKQVVKDFTDYGVDYAAGRLG